jgi:hypothetical protein
VYILNKFNLWKFFNNLYRIQGPSGKLWLVSHYRNPELNRSLAAYRGECMTLLGPCPRTDRSICVIDRICLGDQDNLLSKELV